MTNIILFNKPFNVLSQFTDKSGRATLKDFINEAGFYPAGRLDYDSEGLLLLVDNGKIQQQISDPKFKLVKSYWVQVEGIPNKAALKQLANGVELNDGLTLPAEVKRISAPKLWQRNPPIRVRKNVPDCWLKINISEGRNRQVRRMCAAIGHPVLRLVRVSIGHWQLNPLLPGEYVMIPFKNTHLKK